jgi:hypothetical protein
MGNPTLREGMESADGWVEYLHDLLDGYFYGRTDFKFYKHGEGKFDAETKRAVEQYQREQGFTGDDVDGVVGDRTWSALQGHSELAPEGTDGYAPGTYVDRGKHLRFHPTEMGYANGVDNSGDQLYLRVIIVGDQDVPSDEVKPFLHVEGPNGTTEPTQLNYYPGQHGPGGWFEVWYENATNNGPAGRYRAIAQLPMEFGGDTAQFEFDREVPA